jgi:hypothetical protein
LRGQRLTEAADVYGVGLLIWEALAGRSPIRGLTPDETVRRQLDREAPPLPEAGALVAATVARCLRKRSDERPRLSELQEALERAKATEELRETARAWLTSDEAALDAPATAPAPDTAESQAEPAKAHRAVGTLAVLALGTGLLWATAAVPRQLAPLEPETPPTAVRFLSEATSLDSYWAACSPSFRSAMTEPLRLDGPLRSWLGGRVPRTVSPASDEQLQACALRLQLLLPSHAHGRRQFPHVRAESAAPRLLLGAEK